MGLNVRKKVSETQFNDYYAALRRKIIKPSAYSQSIMFAGGCFSANIKTSSNVLYEFIRKEFAFVLSETLLEHDFLLLTENRDLREFEKPEAYRDAGKIEFLCEDVGVISIDYDNNVLLAHSYKKKESILLTRDLSDLAFILRQGHLFVHLVNFWARQKNLLLLHCAAISASKEQPGVLICGRGGRGKSTLAIAALLEGCSYISDDYLLLRAIRPGLVEVYPIYSIVTMSKLSYDSMKGFDGEFIGISPWTGKGVYSIRNYKNAVAPKMQASKVVFPNICNAKQPSIAPCSSQQPISHIVTSTLSQLYGGIDRAQVPVFMRALAGLKYYQYDLTADIRGNAKFLADFINLKVG